MKQARRRYELHANPVWGDDGAGAPVVTQPVQEPLAKPCGIGWRLGNGRAPCISLPFGDELDCNGSDPSEQHYTGRERDAESGNDYFGARYYASSMGRFLSPDWSKNPEPVPYADLGNPQSLNLYSYAGNNPLIHIDADGNCWGGLFGSRVPHVRTSAAWAIHASMIGGWKRYQYNGHLHLLTFTCYRRRAYLGVQR